ncbi:MAG: hypothetical protein EXR50_01440 [Dehalococcoidia bacterium]|nr:hypothetical protein [Dehalococcoidia bacterium]
MQTQGYARDMMQSVQPRTVQNPLAGFKAILHPEEGWTTFALLAIMTWMATRVVQESKWVTDMPSLWGMGLGALFLGYVLAKVRVHSLLLYPIAVIVGAIAIAWQMISVSSAGSLSDRIVDVIVREYSWYILAKEGGISTDSLPFILQVVVLIWVIAFLCSWFIFRYRHILLGVLPLTIGLLVNLNYVPGRFLPDLALFLVTTVTLIIRVTFLQKEERFRSQGAVLRPMNSSTMLWSSLGFGVFSVLIAWNLPLYDGAPLLDSWDKVSSPWRSVEGNFDRLFASVSSGRASPLHSFNGSLAFRSGADISNDVLSNVNSIINRYPVFTASTDEPGYWRAESYDVYTGKGWLSSDRESVGITGVTIPASDQTKDEYKKRKQVTAGIEVGTPGDVVFSRGQPLVASTDTQAHTGKMPTYVIELKDLRENQRLPSDLRRVAVPIRDALQGITGLPNPNEIQRMLPPDVLLEPEGGISRTGSEVTRLRVFRSGPKSLDIWSLRATKRPSKNEKYSVVSSISVATADDLRSAPGTYPGWVAEKYLQLPSSLPDRVKNLAKLWAGDSASSAYDKTAAIETRLREFTYDLKAPSPARDRDAVDYLLFDSKRGYADHFASAMVALLRSNGIPARLAVGYVNGDYNSDKDAFEVKEKHAHAWPEVFFPDYGWIDFNPSSSLPVIDRSGDTAPASTGEELLEDPLPSFADEEEQFNDLNDQAAADGLINGFPLLPMLRPAAGISLLLMAMALGIYILWTFGLSKLSMAGQGYEKLCRLAILANLGPKEYQTPSEYGDSLAQQLPSLTQQISLVINTYVRERFGMKALTTEEKKSYDKSWTAIRNALALKAIRWRTK